MKITRKQIKKIIEEELTEARLPAWERPGYVPEDQKEIEARAIADMDKGLAREFAQDVIEYVRREIFSEQAPALVGMSMGDFLRLAADLAGDESMAEPVRGL